MVSSYNLDRKTSIRLLDLTFAANITPTSTISGSPRGSTQRLPVIREVGGEVGAELGASGGREGYQRLYDRRVTIGEVLRGDYSQKMIPSIGLHLLNSIS